MSGCTSLDALVAPYLCTCVRVTHRRGIGGEQGMAQQRPTHVLRCKEYRLVGCTTGWASEKGMRLLRP